MLGSCWCISREALLTGQCGEVSLGSTQSLGDSCCFRGRCQSLWPLKPSLGPICEPRLSGRMAVLIGSLKASGARAQSYKSCSFWEAGRSGLAVAHKQGAWCWQIAASHVTCSWWGLMSSLTPWHACQGLPVCFPYSSAICQRMWLLPGTPTSLSPSSPS